MRATTATLLLDAGVDILTLAKKLKENTIEKLLAKDDAEVALDVLLGKLKM